MSRLPAVLGILAFLAAGALAAQGTTRVAERTDAVRVYLDCDERGCDREYLIEEVGFVNWMRDRADADVHLLVSTIPTGGGGTAYNVAFIGENRFAGVRDSLRYDSVPNEATDATRSGLARVIKLGLVRFVAGTSAARDLVVSYTKPAGGAKAVIRDPWNSWTYEVSADAFGNGEQSYGSLRVFSNLEANRVTEQWKAQVQLNNSYSASRYELTDGTFHNYQRSSVLTVGAGKSIGDHWGAAGFSTVGRSDFQNQRLSVFAAPALEYNIFPYSQANRRQLTILYLIGPRHFRYRDTTLYERTEESLVFQQLLVGLRAKQRWGSSNISLSASNYPTAPDFYKLSANGHVELQLVKGLSMRVGGYAARVNDQLYLQKGNLTDEERLVRQRSLATNYEYRFGAGVSYKFGSIYNTVVNPRFRTLGDG